MSSLYNIGVAYQAAFYRMADEDIWEEFDLKEIGMLSDSLEDKAINLAAFIRNLEAEATMVANAKKEMAERQNSLERKAERLRDYLLNTLQSCRIDSITKSPLFKIKLKTNPPSIQFTDESAIPLDYYKSKEVVTIDKTLIKLDIDRGIEVPGAIVVSKQRVEIK